VTGVVHGFEADCPYCAAARLRRANRWAPLRAWLYWLAFGEVLVLVAGSCLPLANAVWFALAWIGIVVLARRALLDLERLRWRRRLRRGSATA
jgi:hypothetical protein